MKKYYLYPLVGLSIFALICTTTILGYSSYGKLGAFISLMAWAILLIGAFAGYDEERRD